MNTFYFNTGVKPRSVTNWPGLFGNQILRDTVLIPFNCDAPKSAVFQFACDYADLPESRFGDWLVCEIAKPNKCMLSKYAYFRILAE